MLIGELLGRLLWTSDVRGVAFVGAMLAVGCAVASIVSLCRAVIRWLQ